MMPPANALTSRLPGRIRVRHPALRRADLRKHLEAEFAAIAGMTSVSGNLAAGSLLLHYDPTRCDREAIEAQVATLSARALGDSPAGELGGELAAPLRPATHRSPARRINQLAKLGMLVSLLVSLALAASGNKRLHSLSGGAFTLLLLAHLIVHRRHLTQ